MSSNPEPPRRHESSDDRDEPGESEREPPIADLSPSSKLIFKVLEYEGELTQEELADESRLCSRTVRYALRRLEDAGAVASRAHLADARQSVYWLEGSACARGSEPDDRDVERGGT